MKNLLLLIFLLSFGFSFGQKYPGPIVNVEGQPAIQYDQKIICGFDQRTCLRIIDPIFFPVPPPPIPSGPEYRVSKDEVIVVVNTEKGEQFFATKRESYSFLKAENGVEFEFLRPLDN